MLRYICKKAVGVMPTLIVVVTFVSFFVYLVLGGPVRQAAGSQTTKENVELVREQLGLNKPLPQQYISYVAGLTKGDLGTSLRTKRPILTETQGHYMNMVQLTFLSLTWSVIAGVLTDVWSEKNRGRWQDYTGITAAVSDISMSSFWIGFMLIMVFVVKYRLLPTTGIGSFKNLILPPIVLGVSIVAIITRFTHSFVIGALKEDYVRMARVKGLREKTAIWKHVLHNCMISVVTIVELQPGSLLGGSVVTETVFAFPGLDSLLIESINYRDHPTIQSPILTFSLYFVLINLVVDVLCVVLNPEIQLSQKGAIRDG